MGWGTWRRGLAVAAIAAGLSGCASNDQASYKQPATYQPPVQTQTSAPPVASSDPVQVAEVERPPTPSPYKPVLKTAAAPPPAEPVIVPEYSAPPPKPVLKTQTDRLPTTVQPQPSRPKTQEVAALIQASRAAYPGNCACPYDRDRAGRRCGKRSAYSRAGGYSVLCYPSDIKGAEQSSTTQGSTYAANLPAPSISGGCGGSYYGATSCITGRPKTTYVRGYYRKDGTYVRPHYRSRKRY